MRGPSGQPGRLDAARRILVAGLARGVALAALAGLAACAPLPRPFQPPVKAGPRSIPGVAAPAGILVAGVADAPAPLARSLAEAMASGLRRASLPARLPDDLPPGFRPLYRIEGRLRTGPRVDGRRPYLLLWELRDAEKAVVGRYLQSGHLDSGPTAGGGDPLARAVREEAARYMAESIRGEPTGPLGVPLPPVEASVRIAVEVAPDAPGDGARSLSRALESVLAKSGLVVVVNPDRETFRVEGRVRATPAGRGVETVEVTWRLLAPDGGEVGIISQKSDVAAGSLDGPWGPVARAVAAGAADGVVALVDRYRLERGRLAGEAEWSARPGGGSPFTGNDRPDIEGASPGAGL